MFRKKEEDESLAKLATWAVRNRTRALRNEMGAGLAILTTLSED